MCAPRLARDEQDVQKVLQVLSSWADPFRGGKLHHLSSGSIASPQVLRDLLQALAKGEAAMAKFMEECIETQKVSIYEPISKLQLQTCSSRRKGKGKNNSRMMALKTDRNLFGRMIIMAQTWAFDMPLLFSHSLGPVPWSLANADGTPVKTTKSTLLVALEAGVPPVEEVLSNAAHAIDAMAMIQSMKAVSGTFADFAKAVFAPRPVLWGCQWNYNTTKAS